MEKVAAGGRNMALQKMAVAHFAEGVSIGTAYERILGWNAAVCDPPYDETATIKIINRVYGVKEESCTLSTEELDAELEGYGRGVYYVDDAAQGNLLRSVFVWGLFCMLALVMLLIAFCDSSI